MPEFLILGCGFTGVRVARNLIARGERVTCVNRQTIDLPGAVCLAWDDGRLSLPSGAIVLYSIPDTGVTEAVLPVLQDNNARRVVYLSTTGVYGTAMAVDAQTQPAPETPKDRARLETEQSIVAGPWSSLVLRPAAIYGPGRGVHTHARTGVYRAPPGGDRVISRIHVDDLAAQAEIAMLRDWTGAYPIADEEPCPSQVVAQYAFELLVVPFATEAAKSTSRDETKSDRRVDGSAFRQKARYTLLHATFREGVRACLAEEAGAS